MFRFTVARPSPAFVVAVMALLMAMAGTGYAATAISGKLIKKRSVPANRVVTNSLTGTQINESRLGTVPLSAKALLANSATSALSADTAKTALTADTAKTADKAADADKLGGRAPSAYLRAARVVRVQKTLSVPANTTAELQATCNPTEVPVAGGGGWFIVGTNTSIASAVLSVSVPVIEAATGQMKGWRVEGKNISPVARDFHAYAICLPVG